MSPTKLSLEQLIQSCEQQLQAYARTRERSTDSSSCVEIVQRAVAGDDAALTHTIAMVYRIVEQHCPADLRASLDDLRQEVVIRISRKLRHRDSPLIINHFGTFRKYVDITLRNTASTFRKTERKHTAAPLDEQLGNTLTPPPLTGIAWVEAQQRLMRCLELLPDRLEREAFHLRYARHASVDEILAVMQARGLATTKQEIYRATERAIIRLSQHAEVREMFESDGGIAA
ncbi:MAG: sigma-70 family RNA polymerase sigma factor [Chloroflexaceae bacterium]|nr:sigma-70 family RNA polymerase sigma factor [Chloroflexaceae bacterium]